MTMAQKVPFHKMRQIATRFLGIEMDEMRMIQAKCREDLVQANYDILELWRDNNRGPTARSKLHACLTKASTEGLTDEAVFGFLMETPASTLSGTLFDTIHTETHCIEFVGGR